MRWFRVRRADVLLEKRNLLEQYGVVVVQQQLATTGNVWLAVHGANVPITREEALAWLTEQYDRAERKETWSITMEAAITVFVLAELLLNLFNCRKG